MNETPENPPAFPACNEANVNGTMGMSLRDWFAGQALSSIMTNVDADYTHAHALARDAYELANAMLEERAK